MISRSPDAGFVLPRLQVKLLGSVSIRSDDVEISVTNRKSRALLAYLALLDAKTETRERLIGLLWSETEEARARSSLRQTLYEVRMAFEGVGSSGVLSTTRIAVALDRAAVTTDIGQVLAEAEAGRVHDLLLNTERLTDTLLSELELVDPAFQSWLLAKRQSLHDQLARLLTRASTMTDPPDRTAIALARVNLDPTDEEATRVLMGLRSEMGDIGGALAIYKRLWDLLANEFDVEPSTETQDLAVQMKLSQPDSSHATAGFGLDLTRTNYELPSFGQRASLSIVARGVSEEQTRAFETLMASRTGIEVQRLPARADQAWLVDAPSATIAAGLAFELQSAFKANTDGSPQLIMAGYAADTYEDASIHRAITEATTEQFAVTEAFRDNLVDGVDATIHDLGFVRAPNSNAKVRAFNVAPPQTPTPSTDGSRLRPAIAVLPFAFPEAKGDSATLSELWADEIITALSGAKDLDVISRLSTRVMTPGRFGLGEIWSHLQSDYVLSATPRPTTGATGLLFELVDTRTKVVKWTHDRDASVLDAGRARELAEAIAMEVRAAILVSESDRVASIPLASLQSYSILFAAITLMDRWTRTSFERSHELLTILHERAPSHPLSNAWFAAWHIRSISQGWTQDAAADGRAAIDFAQRSLDSDPHCSLALAMDGWANVHAYKRLDTAADKLSLAVESNPNDSLAWLLKGVTHAFNGEGASAAAAADRALRLSPLDPRRSYYDAMAATAQIVAGNYDRGIDLAKRSLRVNRLHPSVLRVLVIGQWRSGREVEARKAAAELMALEPTFTVSKYLRNHPAGGLDVGRAVAEALRGAGVPQ